mgnify:CR=1 FL=1
MQKDKNITQHFNLITEVLNRVDKLRSDSYYERLEEPKRIDLMISLEYANLSINELKNLLSYTFHQILTEIHHCQIFPLLKLQIRCLA